MFAHNSVALSTLRITPNHPKNSILLTRIEPTPMRTADKRFTTWATMLSQKNYTLNDHKEDQAVLIRSE